MLGVEVTELIREAGEDGYSPPQSATVHKQVVALAKTKYLASGSPPVDVLVYFSSRPKPAKDFESQTVVCFGHRLEAMAALVEARYS